MAVDPLIRSLRDSRLLPPATLDELLRTLLPQCPGGGEFVAELVRRGLLTSYQHGELLAGRGKQLVLGPYTLLEPIGEGGMGAVWRARQSADGRIVALKVIHKDRRADAKLRERFLREARTLIKLAHPNIVTALDVAEATSAHYFAMEFVEGRDLADVIRLHGPLPLAPVCDYMRQAALALQHAYENGLVHRDIKPSNLLIQAVHRDGDPPEAEDGRMGRWGTVKLFDLGLVLLQDNERQPSDAVKLTRTGFSLGTVEYTAPEQIMDAHRVDIRADLYSLGCSFYEAVTGRVPFPEPSVARKLYCHQAVEPRPAEELRPDLPPEVAAVIKILMAKHPEARFQTPADCAAILARCLDEFDEADIPWDWSPFNTPKAAAPATAEAASWWKRWMAWGRPSS